MPSDESGFPGLPCLFQAAFTFLMPLFVGGRGAQLSSFQGVAIVMVRCVGTISVRSERGWGGEKKKLYRKS